MHDILERLKVDRISQVDIHSLILLGHVVDAKMSEDCGFLKKCYVNMGILIVYQNRLFSSLSIRRMFFGLKESEKPCVTNSLFSGLRRNASQSKPAATLTFKLSTPPCPFL